MSKREIELPIDWVLVDKLHQIVAVHSLKESIDLYELKGSVDAFYKRFLDALEPRYADP